MKTIVDQLLTKPKKDNYEETPHIQVDGKNIVHQADILYLPNDKGYKYCLVVVDLGSRLTDAEPLKSLSSGSVTEAFKKIYSTKGRNILKIPERLEVDPGSEFKGSTSKFFESKSTYLRYGKPGRSRMQSLVENRNQVIGNYLLKKQIEKEIQTNKVNTEWLKNLPQILKLMNKRYEVKKFKPISNIPIITKRNHEILMEGDKVRIILDKPVDYFGKKLPGRFRSADIRYSPKIHTIETVLLRSGYPPMYIVNDFPHVPYTKSQLLPIPKIK
jgi:hypothetical protein